MLVVEKSLLVSKVDKCNIHAEQNICSWMRQNKTKFGLDLKVEFKESFKLYCQISVKGMRKLPKISYILHGLDESEQNASNI